MINKEELRIGNLVNYEATTHIITGLLDEVCMSKWAEARVYDPYTHPYSELKGIPLNKTDLVKFGFVHDTVLKMFWKEAWAPGHPSQRFDIYWTKGKHLIMSSRYQGFSEELVMPHIKYLHQLQNLYFSITEEEIIVY